METCSHRETLSIAGLLVILGEPTPQRDCFGLWARARHSKQRRLGCCKNIFYFSGKTTDLNLIWGDSSCGNMVRVSYRLKCHTLLKSVFCSQNALLLAAPCLLSVFAIWHITVRTSTFGILLQKHIHPDIANAVFQLKPMNKAGSRAQSSQVWMSTSG